MKLLMKVARITVSVLVNSGGTYDFLQKDLIPYLGVKLAAKPRLHVYVENWGKVVIMGLCKSTINLFPRTLDVFQTLLYLFTCSILCDFRNQVDVHTGFHQVGF